MASNDAVPPCFDSHQQQQQRQSSRCPLPSIPHDLVQPLRDALPKIDEALLSSVPVEAVPLCQQLFNAWLSTNTPESTITRPPRAKTTMNIASLCLESSPPLLPRKDRSQQHHEHDHHPYQQQQFAQTSQSLNKSTMPNQCRKSQSTSRLSSWFSWSFSKRRNPTVVPMDLDRKKSAHQNISDFASVKTTATSTCSKDGPPTFLSTDVSSQQQKRSQLPSLSQRPQPPALPQRPQPQQIQQILHPRAPQGVHHHTNHQYTQSHYIQQQQHPPELSPSLSSSSSTTSSTSATYLSRTSQRANDTNSTGYRRSFSFMLSKLGTKVRRVIQSSSQSIHPQLKSANIAGTAQPLSGLSQINAPSASILTSTKQITAQSTPICTDDDSLSKVVETNDNNDGVTMETHSDSTPLSSSSGTLGLIRPMNNLTDDNDARSTLSEYTDAHHTTSKSGWRELSFNLPPSSSSSSSQKAPLTHLDSEMNTTSAINDFSQSTVPLLSTSQDNRSFYNSIYPEVNNNDYSDYSEDDDDEDDDDNYISEGEDKVGATLCYDDYEPNLKTPWSPPSSLAKRTIKSSKTDTNMKNQLSVPFIKMGLGRRTSLDVEDQVQYTTRSMSSTSFALQWQEKFHDQQQPRERIVGTLKSVSLTLYGIIRHNHAYHQFNSDSAYVAHPNFDPARNTKELFAPLPMTHWRDIFDQIAYIYDNGVLTAEHAIITMIYIERMLENSKQHLYEGNWRLIVLAGLITSIKVWDDCAVYNMDFVHIFPELNIKHINLLERRFLEHIDWDVSVRCSLFASTYFELREHR